jgi:hypothetical protein
VGALETFVVSNLDMLVIGHFLVTQHLDNAAVASRDVRGATQTASSQ